MNYRSFKHRVSHTIKPKVGKKHSKHINYWIIHSHPIHFHFSKGLGIQFEDFKHATMSQIQDLVSYSSNLGCKVTRVKTADQKDIPVYCSVGNEGMNSCKYETTNSDLEHRQGRRQIKMED